MLVHWVADPVDPWVVPDGTVCSVNKNDFEVLVGGILQDKGHYTNFVSNTRAISQF